MIASAPASKKRQTQLTVFAITSLKDFLSSIVTPQSGENIGSADISDGHYGQNEKKHVEG